MPFSTSNVQVRNLGGGLRKITGNWSSAAGDTAGTIGVAGNIISPPVFVSLDSSGPKQDQVQVSTSTSGAITTVTVYHLAPVTTGVFSIEAIGG